MSDIEYIITDQGANLFTDKHVPSTTIYNTGPDLCHVSTGPNPQAGNGIPLNPKASIVWSAHTPCYAICDTGNTCTLKTTDNGGPITDPSAIAGEIIAQGLAQEIANAINIVVPAGIATAIANTPPTADHVIQFTKVSYTPAVVGENYGSFSAFYVDGIQHHYPETYFIDPSQGDFRVLKSLFSMRNNGAGVARVTYSMRRANATVPDGLYLALNTVRCAPGEVVNFEIEYLREADAATIGGTDLFEPLFSIFTDSTDIEIDLSFVCGGFGSSVAPPTPHPPAPHDPSTLIQTSSIGWGPSGAPPPTATIVFPNPVAVGDVVVVGIASERGDIDSVSGLGSSAWNLIKSGPIPASNYMFAQLAWFRATTAGTTVTIHFVSVSTISGGHAIGWQVHGVSAPITTQTMPNTVGTADIQTPALDATSNQVYVGVSCRSAGGGVVGYTESPEPFTSTLDVDSVDNDTWLHAGLLIASNNETISRTVHMGGGTTNISVAAVFT